MHLIYIIIIEIAWETTVALQTIKMNLLTLMDLLWTSKFLVENSKLKGIGKYLRPIWVRK
jgi:hypothetical protein